MIVDKLENLERYIPKQYKKEILQWVGNVHQDMPEGIYTIAGEDVYAKVLSYRTKLEESCKIEAHGRYVDIQSTICGVEGINVYRRELQERESEYDNEKDVLFYKRNQEPYLRVKVKEGYFAMLFSHEAHQPEISFDGECSEIKKFVIKIKEQLYE